MSIFVQGAPGDIIEKTMSLSLAEFEKSLSRIDPEVGAIRIAPGRYQPTIEGGGRVQLAVTVLEPMLMGGLVNLPRCKVTIIFEEMSVTQRSDFLNRFDKAFQRGGG